MAAVSHVHAWKIERQTRCISLVAVTDAITRCGPVAIDCAAVTESIGVDDDRSPDRKARQHARELLCAVQAGETILIEAIDVPHE